MSEGNEAAISTRTVFDVEETLVCVGADGVVTELTFVNEYVNALGAELTADVVTTYASTPVAIPRS